MILEIDTSLLKKIDNLSLNQLVFLSLVLDNNQKSIKEVKDIVSQVSDNDIQDLINRGFLTKEEKAKKVSYKETKLLVDIVTGNISLFEEFKQHYPIVVTRPDGTKGFLQSNSKKCRTLYNKIVKNDTILHNRIIKCLDKELSDKLMNGKIGYMKTMWKWLTNSEWENYEEQIDEPLKDNLYGTELI